MQGKVQLAEGAEIASMTWQAAAGESGKVVADSQGAFKVPVDLSDSTGDVSVVLSVVDTNGTTSRTTVSLHDGRLKPAISLASPARGSAYGSVIRVSGTVTDPYAGQAVMGGIESASYLLAPVSASMGTAPARGTVTLDPTGAFRFSLPSAGLSGDQNLTLTVIGRSGNRTAVTTRLTKGDGDLSGFRLAPADRTASVTWDQIPFVQRYDLTVTTDGSPAVPVKTLTGVSAPATVSGLEDGTRYVLQVKATFDDGSEGLSAAVKFIPLSPQSLAPLVTGEYQQIRLSWKSIPGASGYDVWRAVNSAGAAKDYARVAASLSTTTWNDAA
ncbi:MAG TPA: hypothetical protein VL359_00555, partial [bacterium]|nr:hypothetical protein [bacterium]